MGRHLGTMRCVHVNRDQRNVTQQRPTYHILLIVTNSKSSNVETRARTQAVKTGSRGHHNRQPIRHL